MPTLLDHLDTDPVSSHGVAVTTGAAQRLRTTMAACRVSFTWWGVQRTLTSEQKAQAAQAFDAEGEFLSAGKKLLDTKHTAFRAVTAIRTRIGDYWKGLSLPFPEAGVRLIKQESVEDFDRQMADYRAELNDAVVNLDRHFDELKQAAARRLGSLYNPSDYPETLIGLFGVAYNFPSIEPPDYLVQLSPGLYEREQERVRARFEEAVRLAEQAFVDEFARLVNHLTERISSTNEDGTSKVFRDTVVGNLDDFFERFRSLNVRSNQQLDDLVAQAQRAVRNVGRRTCATARRSGARWPPSSLGFSRRSTPCWSTGRDDGSSATRRPRRLSRETARQTRRDGPGDLQRDDRPCRARPPDDHPGQPGRA